MTIHPQNAELARKLRSLSIVQDPDRVSAPQTIQAPRGEERRRWPLLLVLAALSTAGIGYWATRPDAPVMLTQIAAKLGLAGVSQAEQAPSVTQDPARQIVPAVAQIAPPVPQGAIGTGYVVAERESILGSDVGGRVIELSVGVGDRFARGQVLARLDDSAAQLNLSVAELAVKSAEQALSRLQVQREEAAVSSARAAKLVARGAVPATDKDSAAFALRLLDSDILAAKQAVEARTLDLNRARADLARLIITAPFDGVVVEQLAVTGDLIPSAMNGGDPSVGLFNLLDTSSLIIEADLAETNLAQVWAGQRAEVVLDAWPDRSFEAHVQGIVPRASIQKGTVTVRLTFDTPDPAVLANMAARVTFAADTSQ